MQRLFDIILEHDFTVNLVAGVVVFVLDLLIVSVFLSWLLQRRRNREWVPARKALARLAIARVLEIFDALFTARRDLGGVGGPDDVHAVINQAHVTIEGSQKLLLAEISVYSASFSARFMSLISDFLSRFETFCSSCLQLGEPKPALPPRFDAVKEYQELLESLANLCKEAGLSTSIETSAKGKLLRFLDNKNSGEISVPYSITDETGANYAPEHLVEAFRLLEYYLANMFDSPAENFRYHPRRA